MTLEQALEMIKQETKTYWTCRDLKAAIFADDARGFDIDESIAESVFHNPSLVNDALARMGATLDDLQEDAEELIAAYPDSYSDDNEEFAIWDAADYYVTEVLRRDSRICKRAGW